MRPVVQIVPDDHVDQCGTEHLWVVSVLSQRAVNLLHPVNQSQHLPFQTTVFGRVIGASREPGLFQEALFYPEMVDAILHKFLGPRQDEGPTRIGLDQHQQAIAVLDQLAVKRVDLGTSRLEGINPFEPARAADTLWYARAMPTSSCLRRDRNGGRRHRHGY